MAERHSKGFFDALKKETDMTENEKLKEKLKIAIDALKWIAESSEVEQLDEAQAAAEHALSEMSELDAE